MKKSKKINIKILKNHSNKAFFFFKDPDDQYSNKHLFLHHLFNDWLERRKLNLWYHVEFC